MEQKSPRGRYGNRNAEHFHTKPCKGKRITRTQLAKVRFRCLSNETHLEKSMLEEKEEAANPLVFSRGSVKMAVGRSPFSSRNQRLSLHFSHKPLRAAPLAQTGPAGAQPLRTREPTSRALPGPDRAGRRSPQLPPQRRSGARRAGSRCLRRGGAAGGHGAEQGARGGAAMGLRRPW